MTTISNSEEMDRGVNRRAIDRAAMQQSMAWDELAEPVPWSELAPSQYAVLVRWSALPPYARENDGFSDSDLTRTAVFTAILAMLDADAARCTVKESYHFFGLSVRRTAWISRGESLESWPNGSIELELQELLRQSGEQTVRNLVGAWIPAASRSPAAGSRPRFGGSSRDHRSASAHDGSRLGEDGLSH